jgi:type IV pilus assembly protein PilN
MYSIEINFLKDRGLVDVGKPTGLGFKKPEIDVKKNLPIFIGGGLMALFPILAGLSILWLNFEQAKVQKEIAELDAKIQEIEAKKKEIASLTEKKDKINSDNAALAQVFTQIKPWSAILQDISDQIPMGVQVERIQERLTEEGKKQLLITGIGQSYNGVNDFLLTLQRADFLNNKGTSLKIAQEVDNSSTVELPKAADEEKGQNADIELPPVVSYTIISEFNETPANELLPVLQRKGAVGLVSRIRTLENKGLIQK